MTFEEALEDNQIKEIDSIFPELIIERTIFGYIWTFRCSSSEDLNLTYYKTPVAALANFALMLSDHLDAQAIQELE